jgi:putative flippase GtrA
MWKGYTKSRVLSRGGDLIIQNAIVYVFGGSWFWYMTAVCIGGAFNVVTEFFCNRSWAFAGLRHEEGSVLKEISRFSLVRLYYVPIGFGTQTLLFKVLELPFWVSSLSVTILLWCISYNASKSVFTRSTKGMPRLLRLGVLYLRKRQRVAKRARLS